MSKVDYVTISYKMLCDRELSIKAKGVLCFIMGKPHLCQKGVSFLSYDLNIPPDYITGIIEELIEKGYCKKTKVKDGLVNIRWKYEFTDIPKEK